MLARLLIKEDLMLKRSPVRTPAIIVAELLSGIFKSSKRGGETHSIYTIFILHSITLTESPPGCAHICLVHFLKGLFQDNNGNKGNHLLFLCHPG